MSKTDNLDPYESLANAIVLQAVKDYRDALFKLSLHPNSRDSKIKKEECERFFRSGWYHQLTSVDPEYLLRKLQQEVRR